jgi:hypothetical protein
MIVKHITLLVAVTCLFASRLSAQYVTSVKNNNIKIGAGFANVGGFKGFQYYNEYNRKLTSYFQFAPSVSYAMASTPEEDLFFTQNAVFSTDLNLYFTPLLLLNKLGVLKWRHHNLKLGGGVGMKFLTQSIFTGSAINGMPPDQFSFYKKKRWSTGFNVVAEYEWTIVDKWIMGPRFSLQTYDGGEAIDFIGFNLGMKF